MTRDLVLAVWAAIVTAVVAAEVVGHTSEGFATMRQLSRRLVGTKSVTVLVFVAWMWLGWHLFAR